MQASKLPAVETKKCGTSTEPNLYIRKKMNGRHFHFVFVQWLSLQLERIYKNRQKKKEWNSQTLSLMAFESSKLQVVQVQRHRRPVFWVATWFDGLEPLVPVSKNWTRMESDFLEPESELQTFRNWTWNWVPSSIYMCNQNWNWDFLSKATTRTQPEVHWH